MKTQEPPKAGDNDSTMSSGNMNRARRARFMFREGMVLSLYSITGFEDAGQIHT